MTMAPEYLLWFEDPEPKDVPLVDGRTASLGELFRAPGRQGLHMPNNFPLTDRVLSDANGDVVRSRTKIGIDSIIVDPATLLRTIAVMVE